MSHWTTMKVKAKDRKSIITALKRLFPENNIAENANIRGYSGNRKKADVVCQANECGYDIGFVQNKAKEFDCVADWWGAAREFGNQKDFQGKFNQAYSTEVLKAKAKQQGYGIQEVTQDDGKIRLTVTQY